jgi:hypothetical protein
MLRDGIAFSLSGFFKFFEKIVTQQSPGDAREHISMDAWPGHVKARTPGARPRGLTMQPGFVRMARMAETSENPAVRRAQEVKQKCFPC